MAKQAKTQHVGRQAEAKTAKRLAAPAAEGASLSRLYECPWGANVLTAMNSEYEAARRAALESA